MKHKKKFVLLIPAAVLAVSGLVTFAAPGEFPGGSRGSIVLEEKMGIYIEDLIYLQNELDKLSGEISADTSQ